MIGIFPSTLRLAVVREAGLWPALSLLNNRQRRYRYRLLAAQRIQPTRDILSVPIREGKDQANLGELAEGDDKWFKLMSRGRETLWQRLARMLAECTRIDSTTATEYTEWVELEAFSGSIAPFAGDKEEGAKEAKSYTNEPGELSFWMDRSRQD